MWKYFTVEVIGIDAMTDEAEIVDLFTKIIESVTFTIEDLKFHGAFRLNRRSLDGSDGCPSCLKPAGSRRGVDRRPSERGIAAGCRGGIQVARTRHGPVRGEFPRESGTAGTRSRIEHRRTARLAHLW